MAAIKCRTYHSVYVVEGISWQVCNVEYVMEVYHVGYKMSGILLRVCHDGALQMYLVGICHGRLIAIQ